MKRIISSIFLITCMTLSLITSHANAQSSIGSALPPVIDLLLKSNSPPVNTVPLEPFSPIDLGGFIVNAHIPISVNDPDGNLASISIVDISNPPSINRFSLRPGSFNNITVDLSPEDAVLTITGPQQDLITAIQGLVITEFGERGTTTFQVISTDSEGIMDVDIFVLNPTLPPLNPNNWRPVNNVPLEPVQINNDDLNALAAGIQIPFSVDDPNQNLSRINIDITPQSANVSIDTILTRTNSGIIIRGTNSTLSALNSLRFTPITTLSENYTITVTSIDREGATDIDTFEVNFIGESSTSNRPPVNTVPLEPIQVAGSGIGFVERIPAMFSVDDLDRNLSSIRVDITPEFTDTLVPSINFPRFPRFDDPISTTITTFTESGFIITGSQPSLITETQLLSFIPISQENYTITITSTDSEGATDIDSFEINLINEQPSSNTPPENIVPLEPLQIQADDLEFNFFIDFPFSINDADENLTTVNVEITPPSATIRLDDPTLDVSLVFPDSVITITESGFTIKAQNSRLSTIDRLYLTKNTTQSEDYTITVTSTDLEGATDIDTFDVNFTGEP